MGRDHECGVKQSNAFTSVIVIVCMVIILTDSNDCGDSDVIGIDGDVVMVIDTQSWSHQLVHCSHT